MNLGPGELLIILTIVLLLFGASRLPRLARSMGQASREFKKGVAEGPGGEDHDQTTKQEDPATKKPASPSAG